jgi:hypothetical protein
MDMDRNCVACGMIMKNILPHKKYCGKNCKYNFSTKKFGLKKFKKSELNSTNVGAMHEMIVCVDLLKKGYNVFRSISPAASCDILILKDKHMLRIEVTTGNILSLTGKIYHPKKDESKFDVLALVMHDGSIVYEPEF